MTAYRLLAAFVAGLLGLMLLVPVAVVLVPCLFVRWATRTITRWIEPACSTWQQFMEFDSFAGWKAKPCLQAYHLADDVYETTTDAEGWRGKSTIAESEVLVFGDSYAFGHAISDQHFFADVNPNLRVKAIGVNGFNLVQELMWMKRLAPHMKGKLIVWFVYLGNDLTDSVEASMEGYRVPFVRENRQSGQWEVVTSHLSPAPWPSGARNYLATFSERRAKAFVPGPASDRIFSACSFLIGEAARVVHGGGGRLVVLTIPLKAMLAKEQEKDLTGYLPDPSRFDVDYPDRRLADICARSGVTFVAGRKQLDISDYRPNDTHWNEKGSRRVSDLLNSLYQQVMMASESRRRADASLVDEDTRELDSAPHVA